MYIQSDQESTYRDYVSQNLDSAYEPTSAKSIESRAEIIQGAQQNNAAAVLENPGNESSYTAAKEGAARYADFLLKENSAVHNILKIENVDQDLAHHGATVSTLAIAIAGKLGLTDPSLLQLLGLGALLHDCGHVEASYQEYKPFKELPKSILSLYSLHPQNGADRVRDKRHFDSKVITIIAQHEELVDGSGYPNNFTEKGTDPLSVIVSTANDFDRFVMSRNSNHADSIKDFTLTRMGAHPLDQIQALKQVI